jgi:hypothetical protein
MATLQEVKCAIDLSRDDYKQVWNLALEWAAQRCEAVHNEAQGQAVGVLVSAGRIRAGKSQ